jgi:two-component system, chemotaxis family, chemotaxis protein CheY
MRLARRRLPRAQFYRIGISCCINGKRLILNVLSYLSAGKAGKVVAIVTIEFIAMQNHYPTAEFLLVDSDPKLSEFLAAYLSKRGHPCNASPEADKALDWLGQNRCEVVVVDLKSQNATASSLIASVRAIDSRLPIVVFTEKGCNEAQVRAAMRAGASGYVSKNLPTEQLYCVLARVLATARYNARRMRLQRELLGAA